MYGLYMAFLSFASVTGGVNLGMNSALVNKISFLFAEKKYSDITKLISGFLLLYTIVLVLVLSLVVFLSKFGFINIRALLNAASFSSLPVLEIITIVLFTVLFNSFFGAVFPAFLTGINQISQLQKIVIGYSIFYNLFYIPFLLFLKPSIYELVLFQLCSDLFKFVVIFWFVHRSYSWLRVVLKFSYLKNALKMVRSGIEYFLSFLAQSYWSKIDILIISHFLGNALVSVYVITEKVFRFPSNLFSIASAAQPSFAQLYAAQKKSELSILFIRVLRLHFISKFVFISIFAVFFKEFVEIWIPYEKVFFSYGLVALFSIIFLSYAWGGPFVICLNAMFKQRYLILSSVVGLIINVVLSLVLVNRMGLIGVVVATVVVHPFFFGIVSPYILRRFIDINPTFEYFRIVIRLIGPFLLFLVGYRLLVLFIAQTILSIFFFFLLTSMYVYLVYRYSLIDEEQLFFQHKINNIMHRFKRIFINNTN
ncbi:MAG: hypothetical protein AUJ37_01265 [Candidatus Magasanikbacteria bacterium CG1_02_41_34]|nr:MAG: hypothetical protein AUJ37_01265 [Candidatus Magasanikbacteria bacterium CG1_02_41_34]